VTPLPPDLQRLLDTLPPVLQQKKARELVGGISRGALYKLAHEGLVEAVRRPGVRKNAPTLWRTSTLLAYVASMTSIKPAPRRRKAAAPATGAAS
jgi:hypothetical protein